LVEAVAVASRKTAIIEDIFTSRLVNGRLPAPRRVVTLVEVLDAIRANNANPQRPDLAEGNRANFLKDIVRSLNRNDQIPQSVVDAGYTVRQRTGGGDSFEFIPLPPGQTTAFPSLEPPANKLANPHPVQSLSLPAAAREYGRDDESWLTQVATDLHVIETHVALNNRFDLRAIRLLASHIKLGPAEVDALYYAEDDVGSKYVLACEMKGARETLDEDQIDRVEQAVKQAPGTGNATVVSFGMKIIARRRQRFPGLLWVREYGPPPVVISEEVYELLPPVEGIR
jgi:hypothetical protein